MSKPLSAKSFPALAVGCALMMSAAFVSAPAVAGQNDAVSVFPVLAAHNYCPAGTQPVTYNGVVCCGVPNQSITYRQAMRTGAYPVHASDAKICPEGTKGCH